MGISLHPCKVTMPPERTDCATVLEFLSTRFSRVGEQVWQQRMADGKVHWEDKTLISATDAYVPNGRVFYYREVEQEPDIPFSEHILYRDDEILVACKPHFLPVTPAGRYVQATLLNRLRQSTGLDTLAPMHRIDRETAGLVLFSLNPQTRHRYHGLFLEDKSFLEDKGIRKTYRAVASITSRNRPAPGQSWQVENRIVTGQPWFRMAVAEGKVNARSRIRCLEVTDDRALFELEPLTGKTHQLRVHMSGLGFSLLHDRLYPALQPKGPDNFSAPLQLLACRLAFTDPVTGVWRCFESPRTLHL